MYYNVLPCIAMYYNGLQYVLQCIVLDQMLTRILDYYPKSICKIYYYNTVNSNHKNM